MHPGPGDDYSVTNHHKIKRFLDETSFDPLAAEKTQKRAQYDFCGLSSNNLQVIMETTWFGIGMI